MKRIVPPYNFLQRKQQPEKHVELHIDIELVSGRAAMSASEPISIFFVLRALIALLMSNVAELEKQSSMIVTGGNANAEESDNDAENRRNDRSESSAEPGRGSGNGGTCS